MLVVQGHQLTMRRRWRRHPRFAVHTVDLPPQPQREGAPPLAINFCAAAPQHKNMEMSKFHFSIPLLERERKREMGSANGYYGGTDFNLDPKWLVDPKLLFVRPKIGEGAHAKVYEGKWMAATSIDFYINIVAIGAWIVYKESNWIQKLIWIVLLICFGSITTCAYIFVQFLKLTPQESLQDPICFVLLRNRKRDDVESKSILSIAGAIILHNMELEYKRL